MASAMPKVRDYPICSECKAPWVLRLCFLIMPDGGSQWLWQRDCKHKRAVPVTNSAYRRRQKANAKAEAAGG